MLNVEKPSSMKIGLMTMARELFQKRQYVESVAHEERKSVRRLNEECKV